MTYMIATVEYATRVIAFKLMDVGSKDIEIMSYEELASKLKSGVIKVENLKITNDGKYIEPIGHYFGRYTAFDTSGRKLSPTSYVILAMDNDGKKYDVITPEGDKLVMALEDLYREVNIGKSGIANGNIITDSSGKKYIKPLEGSFPIRAQVKRRIKEEEDDSFPIRAQVRRIKEEDDSSSIDQNDKSKRGIKGIIGKVASIFEDDDDTDDSTLLYAESKDAGYPIRVIQGDYESSETTSLVALEDSHQTSQIAQNNEVSLEESHINTPIMTMDSSGRRIRMPLEDSFELQMHEDMQKEEEEGKGKLKRMMDILFDK